MIKITVILMQPKDLEAFDKHYFGVHVPIIKSLPGVAGITIARAFQAQFPEGSPYIVAEFCFKSKSEMDTALNSKAGQRLYADVPQLMQYLDQEPVIIFGELV